MQIEKHIHSIQVCTDSTMSSCTSIDPASLTPLQTSEGIQSLGTSIEHSTAKRFIKVTLDPMFAIPAGAGFYFLKLDSQGKPIVHIVENYENSGRTAIVLDMDRDGYAASLIGGSSPMLTLAFNLDGQHILPGQHTGTFQIQWDGGTYGGETQKPDSSNTVEESFFIDSTAIQVFDKSIYSDIATAHDPDSHPRKATLKSGSTFYYGLSENYFGTQAVKPSTVTRRLRMRRAARMVLVPMVLPSREPCCTLIIWRATATVMRRPCRKMRRGLTSSSTRILP